MSDGKEIWITLITIALILVFAFLVGLLGIKETTAPVIENTSCEHEFVITSKYDIWYKCYKTYSKCIKCGMEV